MDLHQHVQTERERERAQRPKLRGGERGDDQQHRVRTGEARLIQLVGIDDEVLAQQRQPAGRASGAQILERAVEVGTLGQHRQRVRAAALVCARDLRKVGVLAQRARRGRASLELRDHADPRPAECLAQAALATRGGGEGKIAQLRLRALASASLQLGASARKDVRQHAHRAAAARTGACRVLA